MRVQDIHLTDENLWEQFYTLWNSQDYTSAINLLETSQLDTKVFLNTVINDIQNQLIVLQNNSDPTFKNNIIQTSATPPVLSTGEVYFQT